MLPHLSHRRRPATVGGGFRPSFGTEGRSTITPLTATVANREDRAARLEQERQRWLVELSSHERKLQSAPSSLHVSQSEPSLDTPAKPAAVSFADSVSSSTRSSKEHPVRRKRNDFGAMGIRLLKGDAEALHPDAVFSTRRESHAHAAGQFLQGLQTYPTDGRLALGFDVALQTVRQYDEHRFAAWPFNSGTSGPQRTMTARALPDKMRAPSGTAVTHNSAGLKWETNPEGVGYEVEIAIVDALDGQQSWSCVYKGPNTACCASNLGREAVGIRARVRAYNSAGKGEWSGRSELLRLSLLPPPKRVEVDEIPQEWRASLRVSNRQTLWNAQPRCPTS